MTSLEKIKIEAELAAVHSAKMNMQVRIAEAEDTIQRMREHIKIQEAKEKELQERLK